MSTIFGVPTPALYGQILIGLINGSFYAMLSLGLAVIFGLLRVINFAHGAQYMLGAFAAYLLLTYARHRLLAGAHRSRPCIVGASAIVIERTMLSRLYGLDPLYGLLLTFGLALILEGAFRYWFGAAGKPYAPPAQLTGGVNLGFMFLPIYRGWVVVASLVDLPRHLAAHREDAARRLPARRDRERHARPGLRRERAAASDAHLRPRRGACRRSPACWRRRSIRSAR